MMKDILKTSCMAFELKNGEILLISNEDISEIAGRLVVEMMIHKQNQIFIQKDSPVEKCKMLYQVVKENRDIMSPEELNGYFHRILELMDGRVGDFVTLESKIEDK